MTGLTTTAAPDISELEKKLAPETVHAVKTFMSYLAEENLPGIVKVLLYGSRARGSYQPESDIDHRLLSWPRCKLPGDLVPHDTGPGVSVKQQQRRLLAAGAVVKRD